MDQEQYKALVASLDSNERGMLDVAKRLGKAKVSDMRGATVGRKTGKPLAYGLTRELETLEQHGLIQRIGRKAPAEYAFVKPGDVEGAAQVFTVRKRRSAKKRKSLRPRIAQLRAKENGEYGEFHRVHRYIVEATEYIGHHLTKMAFWEVAPKELLARSVEDLATLIDAIDEALVCLAERAEDDALAAKIEKLARTSGRTTPEAEAARTLARKLQAQYEDRLKS